MTETTLMKDANATVTRLNRLKELGVVIAIDDFGTGYSSLAYLRQFPVDVIKIDRSFVSEMDGSAEAAALIHTLVELGRTLGLVTLAEGIEEDAQLGALREMQCGLGQGYISPLRSSPPTPRHSCPERPSGEFHAADPGPGSVDEPSRTTRVDAADRRAYGVHRAVVQGRMPDDDPVFDDDPGPMTTE